MKMWFTKMKQAISGRLMKLKRAFGKDQLLRYRALLHGRLYTLKDQLKEFWLIVKCAVLLLACKLYLTFNREALKRYAQWLRELPEKLTWENVKKCGLAFLAWLRTLPETLRNLRKAGVLASVSLFLLLAFLGAGATAAWMTYTTPVKQNNFQVGLLDLYVEYRNDQMTDYAEVTKESPLFNDEALYEPGYTQIVYLKVYNNGDIPFDYKFTVHDFNSEDSMNVYDENLHLPDHLYFGMVTADTEEELQRLLSPREAAQSYATNKLVKYSRLGEYSLRGKRLDVGKQEFAALIVCMPTFVGNEANYKKDAPVPKVSLGVTVYAQQIDTMDLT